MICCLDMFAISNKLMQSGYDRLTPVAFHDAVPTQQRLPEAHLNVAKEAPRAVMAASSARIF